MGQHVDDAHGEFNEETTNNNNSKVESRNFKENSSTNKESLAVNNQLKKTVDEDQIQLESPVKQTNLKRLRKKNKSSRM